MKRVGFQVLMWRWPRQEYRFCKEMKTKNIFLATEGTEDTELKRFLPEIYEGIFSS